MTGLKFTAFQLTLYAIGFLVLFVALLCVTYFPPAAGAESLISYIVGALGMLSGHIFGLKSAAVKPPGSALDGQAGNATVSCLLWVLAFAFGATLLSGCASLTQAGNTSYIVEPIADHDGKMVCCRFTATDGKEYSGRNISFAKESDGAFILQIKEGASSAFQGQAIAGKALSVLPSFAPTILDPGPAIAVPALTNK